jgi:hypothetical protein
MELLPLKFSRLRDLDHDARVDLVNEGDTSSPDPVHSRELVALNIHHENIMRDGDVLRSKDTKFSVFQDGRGEQRGKNESQEKAGGLGHLINSIWVLMCLSNGLLFQPQRKDIPQVSRASIWHPN